MRFGKFLIGGLPSKIRVSRGPKIASARVNADRAASVARGSAKAPVTASGATAATVAASEKERASWNKQ